MNTQIASSYERAYFKGKKTELGASKQEMWDEMRAHNNDYLSEFLNRLPHFIGQFLVKSSHGLNMRFNIYN